MKVLNVAEKNDAAKTIANVLSGYNCNRRNGQSTYNKIYSFRFDNFQGNNGVDMIFTSVSGHMLNYAFPVSRKNWQATNLLQLFEVPVEKYCSSDNDKIRQTLARECRTCQVLVIWTDCDREGENIGFEVIKACTDVNPRLDIFRARFSDMTNRSIHRAVHNLERPDVLMSAAVDCRQELDLRIGAAFTRFQTLRLQKAFPDDLNDKMISYGS